MISRPPSRGKPCAGGVTEKAVARYRFSIAPVVREAVTSLAVSHSSSPVRHLSSATPFCVMTERAELDAFCRGQAEYQGAVFHETAGLTGLEQWADCVHIETREGAVFQAPWLIAADGANSAVARLLGEASPGWCHGHRRLRASGKRT